MCVRFVLIDAERWKRWDELLQAALQVPAERQEEFLRQQCGVNAELLEEVQSLLTSHRKAGSFFGIARAARRRRCGTTAHSRRDPIGIVFYHRPDRRPDRLPLSRA